MARDLTISPEQIRLAGQRVQQYRLDHATQRGGRTYPMTQVHLAQRARVSVGCLQGMEAGTRVTRRDQFLRIAKAIGLTLEELLAPAPPAPPAPRERLVLTDEALDIAEQFMLADTEERVKIKTSLREHFAQRTDAAAQTYCLQAAAAKHRPRELDGRPTTGEEAQRVATGSSFRRAN